MNNSHCKIDTGDWIGNAWTGPDWTPYARAIADHYPNQVPWFLTIPTTLTGGVGQRRVVVTSPNLYDVLIFGAHISIGSDSVGDNGQTVYLQITHLETGIPWVVPNILGYAPMTAFGGVRRNPTSNMKFPEAFFLPRRTKLKLEFTNAQIAAATGGTITLLGVQLTHPSTPKPPERVTMPNGDVIPVGSRLPWFATIGVGQRIFDPNSVVFNLPPASPMSQSLEFLPPSQCNVEIHDVHCNFFARDGLSLTPDNLAVKIVDMGSHNHWTPNLSPITGVFGVFTQAYPSLPFNKPYLLQKGHRIQILTQNNTPTADIINGLITLRGVRLCEY